MARPFPLLRPGVSKLIDARDDMLDEALRVPQSGIRGTLTISPKLQAELFDRADLLIATRAEGASAWHKLAPRPAVISAGVALDVCNGAPPPARPVILMAPLRDTADAKGLRDFLRFAWPMVLKTLPAAELHLIGASSEVVDPVLPGIRLLGNAENMALAYAEARVVINPAVEGKGLEINTLEALRHLRPVVVWPAGAVGLAPELSSLCRVATDWFGFTRHVIQLASVGEDASSLVSRAPELATQFSADAVYAPLAAALDALPNR